MSENQAVSCEGLVGVIPALGIMTPSAGNPGGAVTLSFGQLLLWSLSLAFIGVFCAVPLRTQTIIKEKLTFPSGTATANVIRTLHGAPQLPQDNTARRSRAPTARTIPEDAVDEQGGLLAEVMEDLVQTWKHWNTPEMRQMSRTAHCKSVCTCIRLQIHQFVDALQRA